MNKITLIDLFLLSITIEMIKYKYNKRNNKLWNKEKKKKRNKYNKI